MSWFDKVFGGRAPSAPQELSTQRGPGAGAHDPTGEPQRFRAPAAQPGAGLGTMVSVTKPCPNRGARIPTAVDHCMSCGAS